MTIEESDRENLIKYRLEQANETILDVELLVEHKRYRSAINRIYYGMFYALLAFGTAQKFETSKHAQLIGWFNQNFIHKGLIDSKYGKKLTKHLIVEQKAIMTLSLNLRKKLFSKWLAK